MSGIKISALPVATLPLSGNEVLPVVQSGNTVQVAAKNVYAGSAGSAQIGFIASGTGAAARTVQAKLRDVVSVKDFGAVGDGITDDTAAIQAAHNYAASINSTGMPQVVFPAGVYVVTSLNWSPLVAIYCGGQVVLKTSITSGIALHVSTEFGNWANNDPNYHGNTLVLGGKLLLINTNGSAGNTATGIFFGDDGIGNYSAESISLLCVHLEGWKYSHRFGSHAYLISFVDSFFGNNENAIFNDYGTYIDRVERLTYISCTFSRNKNVIDGNTNCNGDFTFQACSFDYNKQILPGTTNAMVISVGGGSHLETDDSNSTAPFFTMVGGSLSLNSYYAGYYAPLGGTGSDPIIASVGASGFVRSQGMTVITPTGATLFKLTSTTATINTDDDYRQFGGVAAAYINNSVGGYVEKWFSVVSGSANYFKLGEYQDIKARAIGLYAYEFTKTTVSNGATVNLFSVGPVASYATGRMTIMSTSAGILTVKVVDFSIIGGGSVGGTVTTVSENYSGGASTFTISETANSPSSGYNKLSVTNTSGATCNFSISVQINFQSNANTVALL